MPMVACNLRYAGKAMKGLNLWHYALMHSVCCSNRVIHASDKITPCEHLYHEKPDLPHAKVWACPCFSHITVEQQAKPSTKAKVTEGIFWGRCEVDGLSTDGGDQVLTKSGEITNSAVTEFIEGWGTVRSPAARTTAEINSEVAAPLENQCYLQQNQRS